MLVKLAFIFLGLLFLVCVWLGRRERVREPLKGEKITVEDVEILLRALNLPLEEFPFFDNSADMTGKKETVKHIELTQQVEREAVEDEEAQSEYLTYGQYIEIRERINGAQMNLPDYESKYEEEQEMLKEDWYAAYRLMLAYLDTESSIWETTVFVLKLDTETEQAYTESGGMESPYRYHSSAFEQNVLQQIKAYVKGSELLTVCEVLPQDHELNNVWIMESTDGLLECFYHQIQFRAKTENPVERERVADLTFRNGELVAVREKNEKIHGKLLRITQEEVEIEGCGVYPVEDNLEVYKLYGSLMTMTRADLRIGYADTDFVLHKGKICACLISEEEAADRIRVLLKNTAKMSNYHAEAELVVDGETIQVRAEDMEVGERRIYQCAALTDKVILHVEGREEEDQAYRGSIECYRMADGMALINELPLEEYLYAVVPSEMPALYPLEALKAQAVCARTYAYRNIMHAGLPEIGAHVDDTTSYQVYHNVSENASSTTAVKETNGILLTWQGEPAQNYYYSTSCGVGTNAAIWKSETAADIPYLQALRLKQPGDVEGNGGEQERDADKEAAKQDEMITATADAEMSGITSKATEKTVQTPDDLKDEDAFYQFITSKSETDLEKDEPWYRWSYQVEQLDVKAMAARIQSCCASSPQSVLTKMEGDYYVSQPVEEFEEIKSLSIAQRGAGGVAEELLVETDTGSYKIISEYYIRSVLCDGVSKAVKQDDSTTVPRTLLPSGFFVLETGKEEGNVIGYTLTGGGYGHGVGMSQNGARALGEEGASYRMILEYFFQGCELDEAGQNSA